MNLLVGASGPTRVVLGSTSPAKLRAVIAALEALYAQAGGAATGQHPPEVVGVAADSGVPAQPWGEEETRQGALNRARAALGLDPRAELGVGIEAGVMEEPGWPLWAFAWVMVEDRAGTGGAARSATFGVPAGLAAGVRAGLELGDALDAAYGLQRAKDGPGAVGVLTRGLIHRPDLYRTALLLALMPWLEPAA